MNIKRTLTLVGLSAVLAVGAVSMTFAQRGNGGGGGGNGGGRPGPMGRMMASPAPFIGIAFEPVEGGIKVTQVLEGSPAETAGLQVDDVITAVNGAGLGDGNIREALRDLVVGDAVELSVTRGEESLTISVTLGEQITPMRNALLLHGQARLGAVLEADSLTVSEVLEDSPAAAAGLQVGDTITAINGAAVTTREEIAEALTAAHTSAEEGAEEITVTVTVSRGEESVELTAILPVRPAILERLPDGFPGLGRGMRGMFLQPREDGSGFDVVIPFTLSEGTELTAEAQAAIEGLGWTIQAKEGEEGVYELIIPAESVRGGLNLDALEGIEGLEGLESLAFGFPGEMHFEFSIPEGAVVPAAPADTGSEL